MARAGISTLKAHVTEPFARIGNNLSADFVNTVVSFDHEGGTLRSAGDVVDFLASTGVIEAGAAKGLRAQLKIAEAAARFLATTLELRAAVTAAFTAMEEHQQLGDASIRAINEILAVDAGFEKLVAHAGGYRVVRQYVLDDPRIALVPIASDVARLLATPGAPVRKCAGDACVRHFYDDSRTRRRRWCDMSICGNRAKASAFAERQRANR